MRRKCEKLSILAVIFSLWLPFFTGYMYYDGYGEVDLLSPNLILENPDQENVLADQTKGKVFVAGLDSSGILEASDFSEPFFHFSLPSAFLPRLSVPLRC